MHTRLLRAGARAGDFYPTPSWATEAILDREPLSGVVWEPACGAGDMARVIAARPGVSVIATDLHDRGYGTPGLDFLACPAPAGGVDHVMTNPPYSLARPFVERALAVARGKVLMLLKLNFLEGVGRRSLFERHPPARVWVFSRRVKFPMPGGSGGGVLAYGWFVWQRGFNGSPVIGWIP